MGGSRIGTDLLAEIEIAQLDDHAAAFWKEFVPNIPDAYITMVPPFSLQELDIYGSSVSTSKGACTKAYLPRSTLHPIQGMWNIRES